MGLTLAQRSIVEKAKTVGGGNQGVALSDEACRFLVAVIARDLKKLSKFPKLPKDFPPFFGSRPLASLVIPGGEFLEEFEKLVSLDPNSDTYFACLAAMHKARLKYERILETQPLPTIDQVGPRGLLQYGAIDSKGLTPFILWRKWIFDIDNRAGQETGYVFEPIIAAAIGGVSVSAKNSPVKRATDKNKGRQVDCIRDKRAYEFKIRVTIAASGQGRWREELDFSSDSKASGYVPVLVVLDPTPNPKLIELSEKFRLDGGEVYIGDAAWRHLDDLAGKTMSKFLDTYVHAPIAELLKQAKLYGEELPEMRVQMSPKAFTLSICGQTLTIARQPDAEQQADPEPLPDDVDQTVPGP